MLAPGGCYEDASDEDAIDGDDDDDGADDDDADDRNGDDDDGKNDELFVPGLARGPAGSNCQEGRNSGTDTTRDWDDYDEDICHQNDCDEDIRIIVMMANGTMIWWWVLIRLIWETVEPIQPVVNGWDDCDDDTTRDCDEYISHQNDCDDGGREKGDD